MLVFRGMYGIGDNIHQRAIIRDVMDAGEQVILETFYSSMYHDLVARGLKLKLIRGIPPRIRERNRLTSDILIPRGARLGKITYDPVQIKACGNIMAAQYASANLPMPKRPDFSIPVPREWRQLARDAVGPVDKPILVYRPIVLNNVWRAESRSPDPALYSAIFRTIRDKFHVVSVAHIGNAGECIVGENQDADTNFNRGELDFETMTGLFAEASVTFTNPGFTPILSQAVGTPTIIVYGGNESYQTTNIVGAHLAPTLAIEPDHPCACHNTSHDCDKYITLPPAIARLEEFVSCVS